MLDDLNGKSIFTLRFIISLIAMFFLTSCATFKEKKVTESQNMDKALQSVAGALAGKELSDQDIQNLKKEIQTNGEARDAVKEITNSLQQPAQVKYCPIDGQRYSGNLKWCPIHHVELKEVERE